MRANLDSNVLLYALLEPHGAKGAVALAIISRASGRGVIATQALGELIWVTRRRRPDLAPSAVEMIARLRPTFTIVDTTPELLLAAAELNARHQVPFWDAVIWKAGAAAGAGQFLSEDLQDGFATDGVRVINPFTAANEAELDRLLPP
jgi:predicted nucleic acid-binding protein